MIQVKEMMQDNDLKNSKSKDKGSKSRSQSMDEQSHYKQDKTITRQSINVKRHIFNVIGGTEEFEERDLNIGGDSWRTHITSSSSIDYIPKSPTSFTSPLINGYLNSLTSPPRRISPPPPIQESGSMDITLTLLPVTPLDVQFNTPSPSTPIFSHPIPWNILEAHGDSCLFCIHNHTLIFRLRDELQYILRKEVINKILKPSKNKREQSRSIALKAKKESSDDDSSTSDSEDEEYAMAVRDFKKFFKFVRQPHEERKSFQRNKDDKNGKGERKCFKGRILNHLIENVQNYQDIIIIKRWLETWRDSDKDKRRNK
ncbi:hypothetical protein Tco_0228876 [Tanacetum coccineum]